MKRFDFYYFLTLGILALYLFGMPKLPHFRSRGPKPLVTAQQRMSHRITFIDDNGEDAATCTSTAVGPHALLTDEHCDAEKDNYKRFYLDRALDKHNIIAIGRDNRDHILVLFDGASFYYYAEPKIAEPVLKETVTFYGNNTAHYPATSRYGKVTDCEDPSDIDMIAEQACYDTYVEHGDSGSAIYNTKGEIVGLVTYRHEDDDGKVGAIGFVPNFRQEVLDYAYRFDPSKP